MGPTWASGNQVTAAWREEPQSMPHSAQASARLHPLNFNTWLQRRWVNAGTAPAFLNQSQTATSSRRLVSAAELAKLSVKSPRAMGSSRTAHNSRQLFQARSRAELMVQLAIRLLTALRW